MLADSEGGCILLRRPAWVGHLAMVRLGPPAVLWAHLGATSRTKGFAVPLRRDLVSFDSGPSDTCTCG